MPFSSEGVQPGLAIALSGGGFRAALFHLGSLWRLNEFGMLPQLDRISSISGGSITAGYLGFRWDDLTFDAAGRAGNFEALVVDAIRDFCSREIDVVAIGTGVLLPGVSPADLVEQAYRHHLFGNATLASLPDPGPRFVIGATNFGTGDSFRFSRPYMGDYRLGLIPDPDFPLARAVAASSAFPPVLSPVIVETDPAKWQRVDGADLYDREDLRRKAVLTDGGVYDNLGLETVWNRYETILVSDAGAPFSYEAEVDTSWAKQAMRVMDLTTNQCRALRKRALIADFTAKARKGAYWGIMTDILRYEAPDKLAATPARAQALAAMRTRLNTFTEQEQCELINWGYALADAALRTHAGAPFEPPPAWPYPRFALDRP